MYANYFDQDENRRSDEPGLDLVENDFTNLRYGAEYDFWKIYLKAEQEKVKGHFAMGDMPVIDDHIPLNNAGIPTIDLIGDFASSNWWHTSRDNLELISPESLDISIRVVRGMLLELLP